MSWCRLKVSENNRSTMSKGFFITGTDTGIGKTLVSLSLMQYFIAQGERVIGMKPIASGAQVVNGQLCNDDALALMQASNVDVEYGRINPYCFAPAIAPHLAAAETQVTISISHILDYYKNLSVLSDRVIVEGVGGWRVPIDHQCEIADLAHALKLPVIMVVGMRIGCLNHALLTAEAIVAKGCNLIGWVANAIDKNMHALEENILALKTRIKVPLLTCIPYIEEGKALSTTSMQWPFSYFKNQEN